MADVLFAAFLCSLFAANPGAILNSPTYSTSISLFDNYDKNVSVAEVFTVAEVQEQANFLDAVMGTDVMQQAHQFLAAAGQFYRSFAPLC